MIYVIWSNYDGVEVKEFETHEKAKAEDLIMNIVAKETASVYSTKLIKIIDGEAVSYKVVKEIEKVEIIPHRSLP